MEQATILVVEDDARVRAVLTEHLNAWCELASNG